MRERTSFTSSLTRLSTSIPWGSLGGSVDTAGDRGRIIGVLSESNRMKPETVNAGLSEVRKEAEEENTSLVGIV